MSGSVVPAGYADLLSELKAQVRAARTRATRIVNTEMLTLYWSIGQTILDRQTAEGWGARVIDRLADDLRAEFPDMRGFSRSNLKYMRQAAASWPGAIGQHAAGQLPWVTSWFCSTRSPTPSSGTGMPLPRWSTVGPARSS